MINGSGLIFTAFLMMLAIEFFIVWLFARKAKQVLLYVVLINLFTWPFANFLLFVFRNISKSQLVILMFIILVELLVIASESILLWKLLRIRYSRAFYASLAANLVTAALSFLLVFSGIIMFF